MIGLNVSDLVPETVSAWIVNHKLALAMTACHLSLEGLNHVLLQLLTSNTSWRRSGWRAEMKHSVAREKLAGQVFRNLDIFRN